MLNHVMPVPVKGSRIGPAIPANVPDAVASSEFRCASLLRRPSDRSW